MDCLKTGYCVEWIVCALEAVFLFQCAGVSRFDFQQVFDNISQSIFCKDLQDKLFQVFENFSSFISYNQLRIVT